MMRDNDNDHEQSVITSGSDPQAAHGIGRYFSKFNPLNFKKRSNRTKALFALALVSFFWGTTWVAAKQAVMNMPALQMAGLRQFFAGFCYVIFFIAKGTTFPKGKEWQSVIVLTVLNFMLSNGLSTWGVKYISAGLGSIIGAIFPLWLVIIGLFISKTKLQTKTIVGLLLGFIGICVIFYEHLLDFLNPDFRFGITLSLISTWTWAFGTIYTKKHAANFNPYFSLGLQMLFSGFFLFLLTNITGNAIPLSEIPVQSWVSIAYLVLFGSMVAFVAYLYALQKLPTEQASIYAYINPIVAILIGWMMFNEKLSVFIIAGAIITLYGVYLVNKAAMKIK